MSDKMSAPDTTRCLLRETIPSHTEASAAVAGRLVEVMAQRQWPPRELFRVQLAFQEAVVNAIRHGNRCDTAKTVDVHAEVADQWVLIQITDQGNGFDPAKVPDPRDEALLEVPGGRGVLLIHELMTTVRYNDRGNQITMVRHRTDTP